MKKTNITIPHHGREVYATMYEPEGSEPTPIVIFSHGFHGSGEDFIDYAELLVQNEIAAITFDFCGGSRTYSGKMRSTEMTLFTEEEDLEAVIAYALARERADQENVFLFGGSQGGLVTALTASKHTEIAAGIILLYPALCIPDDWNARFPRLCDIPDTYELWGVSLGRSYFETIHKMSAADKIKDYQKAVLVMHGHKDPVVDVAYSKNLAGIYSNLQLEIFEGEGHGFTQEGSRRAAQLTLEFVQANQKNRKAE